MNNSTRELPDVFVTTPIVYSVGKSYQIFVPVNMSTLMWVRVGEGAENEFFDDANGVLRSEVTSHRMIVPHELLDREKKYTICFRRVFKRKSYYSEVGEIETCEFDFKPVCGDTVHIYHVADAHNNVDAPVSAADYFKDSLDLLIMNGDIPNHSGDIGYFSAIDSIAAKITKGRIPVIFARGNHDTRGAYAEKLFDYVPTDNGVSYYTTRTGSIWSLVLDCGEDKNDSNDEYGHVNCFHDFRRRETKFIENVIKRADEEYNAPGVKHKIVIVHNPFTKTYNPPFEIESELYTYWAKLLREKIKPEIMLCGHLHKAFVSRVGSEHDGKGQPCTVIVASKIDKKRPEYAVGGAITLTNDNINIKFTDNEHRVIDEEDISL